MALPFGLYGFWWEICSHTNLFSSIGKVSFFSAFKNFSLSFILRRLIIMFLGMGFFGFIQLGVCSVSWTWRYMSPAKFRKFSVIISLNNFSVLSLSPLQGLWWHKCWIFCYDPISLMYCSFSRLFFLCCLDWVLSIVLLFHCFFLLSSPIWCWTINLGFYFCFV